MNKMNYEQKYKEVLERAQKELQTCGSADCDAAKQIFRFFPELRESEDERIRKELIERFKWELKGAEEQDATGCNRQKDIAMFKRGIAWLERQVEKRYTWSEEDESRICQIIDWLSICKTYNPDQKSVCDISMQIAWLKSIKPNHWKPSEQNIKDLEWCADLVKDKMGVGFHRLQVLIDKLKKL